MYGGGGEVVYSTLAISLCVCVGGGEVVYSTLAMSYKPVCVGGGGCVQCIGYKLVCVLGGGGREVVYSIHTLHVGVVPISSPA